MEPVRGLRGASAGPRKGEEGAELPSVVVEVRERVEAADEATPSLLPGPGGVPLGRRAVPEEERREGKKDQVEDWCLRACTAAGGGTAMVPDLSKALWEVEAEVDETSVGSLGAELVAPSMTIALTDEPCA
jgi:hypothetical protein